ncbi:MAG: hypothetical protein ACTSUO_00805 [Candidatus Thorarchaeota archaeon]
MAELTIEHNVDLPEGFTRVCNEFIDDDVRIYVIKKGKGWLSTADAYTDIIDEKVYITKDVFPRQCITDYVTVLEYLDACCIDFRSLKYWEYVLLHEYSHILTYRQYGIVRKNVRKSWHGTEFKQTLAKLIKNT